MSVVELVRELARPAPHDHRNLTTDQRLVEAAARVMATGTILAIHCAARGAVGVVNTARTIRTVAHLWRHQ